MRVFVPVLAVAGASAILIQQKLVKQTPGEWITTCAEKGGLITPWYDPAPGEAVPVFCVTATVCGGHLGREESDTALPVTVFNRETKLREEQKSCTEPGAAMCCTDVIAKAGVADCAAGNAPCKLGSVSKFSDYASFTQEFEDDAASFKDDCTNKTPTGDCETTIAANKLEPMK